MPGEHLGLLPVKTRRAASEATSFDRLREMIVDGDVDLDFAGQAGASFSFKDLHAAGPPCADFSAMGRGDGTDGVTMLVFLTWIRGIRVQRPRVIIFENVCRFPMSLLWSLVGDLYCIDHVVLNLDQLGWPIRRERRYAVLTLRRHVSMRHALKDLPRCLQMASSNGAAGSTLFFGRDPSESLSGA